MVVYLGVNAFLEMVREVIEFKAPLMCFAKSLTFLGISAIVTLVGDMNVFWICVFASFSILSMLKKREVKAGPAADKDDKQTQALAQSDLMLTTRGSHFVASLTRIIDRVNEAIPRFSTW